MKREEKLKKMGLILPDAPTPIASYLPYKIAGNMLYISGQGPIYNGKQMYTGKVGGTCSMEDGYEAAKYCALNLLAQMKAAVGDLDRIQEIVNLKGFVSSEDDFHCQPAVINGASDLLVELFGESGRHTRCALGVNSLPTDIPVEIELIAELNG